jgi:hypothetical protein
MKKIFLIILLSSCSASKAQIVLEAVRDSMWLDEEFKTVQISPTETKWFFNDTVNNTFSLYNMDYSPFLTNIAVPVPFNSASGFDHFSVLYITRSLFDCDTSNIEFIYEAPHNIKPLWVMRTDGTILLQVDSANLPYCFGCRGGTEDILPIVNTSAGSKLFIQKTGLGWNKVFVYSLCGSLSTEILDFTSTQSESFVKVFPNPSSSSLTFQINPPDNINEIELVIIDDNAKEVSREKIKGESTYKIEISNFHNGTYFYSLCTKNKSYQNGKFILTH